MKKTVITKLLDAEAKDGVIEFPQNKTLYVDQFTDDPPVSDDEREGFKAKSMKNVFEHFKPSKNGVELSIEGGATTREDFEFHEIKDFEDAQLIAQSETMSQEKETIEAYNSVIRQLEKNKTLRNALKNEEARGNLKNALKALLSELEENE